MKMPTLRFKGFTNSWQEISFGEISEDVMYGMNAAAKPYDGINKYIRITDIDEETREFMPSPLTSPDGLISDKFKLKKNDLVFARTGASVGKTYLYNEKDGNLLFAGFLVKLAITDANPYFIYTKTLTESYKSWLKVISMRSGQPGVNAEELKEFRFLAPQMPEQTKIANFLTAFDDKISQLSQKHGLLNQYKKAVMQQIFSQKLRFKEDDGKDFPDWEWKLASDIFVNTSNKKHEGELPILAATQDRGMIYREDSGLDIHSSEKSVKSYKIVEPGDFVISLRSFQGGIEYSSVKGICSPVYTVMKPKISINDYFFKAYLKKDDFIESLNSLIVGIRDGKQISFNAFSTLSLPYPSYKEQTKIADFLTHIEKKITIAQTELDLTKKYKQGLLQQMFV
jgi:type I restriction enzyme, S subunit